MQFFNTIAHQSSKIDPISSPMKENPSNGQHSSSDLLHFSSHQNNKNDLKLQQKEQQNMKFSDNNSQFNRSSIQQKEGTSLSYSVSSPHNKSNSLRNENKFPSTFNSKLKHKDTIVREELKESHMKNSFTEHQFGPSTPVFHNSANIDLNFKEQKKSKDTQREYLEQYATPVLSKMMVKIVNEQPRDVVEYMIEFLKSEEGKYEPKRFKEEPNNRGEVKHYEDIRSESIMKKYIEFKK